MKSWIIVICISYIIVNLSDFLIEYLQSFYCFPKFFMLTQILNHRIFIRNPYHVLKQIRMAELYKQTIKI